MCVCSRLTEQVSDGCVDIRHLLGQQRKLLRVAVVFHQASVQQQLELEQGAVGEARLLVAAVGLCTMACRSKGKTSRKRFI